ncbi:hypothetical protein SDC9_202146 [bioreactor metagenome]|uniref:Uncharacterized protein n=1 Tax=bioreactor metagenome TaxID=1076179 RepID=A0A645ITI1_9ZZZZ
MLARLAHQLAHFRMRQEGRRAATPVQLDHLMLAIASFKRGSLHIQLLGQILQILGAAPVILGDDLVTGAVVTDGVTEGDVEV